MKSLQELTPGLLQLRASFALRQSRDSEQNLSAHDWASHDSIFAVQFRQPAFHSLIGSHQVADDVGVEKISHKWLRVEERLLSNRNFRAGDSCFEFIHGALAGVRKGSNHAQQNWR